MCQHDFAMGAILYGWFIGMFCGKSRYEVEINRWLVICISPRVRCADLCILLQNSYVVCEYCLYRIQLFQDQPVNRTELCETFRKSRGNPCTLMKLNIESLANDATKWLYKSRIEEALNKIQLRTNKTWTKCGKT